MTRTVVLGVAAVCARQASGAGRGLLLA